MREGEERGRRELESLKEEQGDSRVLRRMKSGVGSRDCSGRAQKSQK